MNEREQVYLNLIALLETRRVNYDVKYDEKGNPTFYFEWPRRDIHLLNKATGSEIDLSHTGYDTTLDNGWLTMILRH